MTLPREFRKASIHQRRLILESMMDEQFHGETENNSTPSSGDWKQQDFSSSGRDGELLGLADSMVEGAIGYHAIPLGLAGPLIIDGQKHLVPMATEEPSVIAAVSYMGRVCSQGIITQTDNPIMSTQIFIEKTTGSSEDISARFRQAEPEIRKELQPLLASMEERGGGWRGMDLDWLEDSQLMVIKIHVDVRNAMGANLLNTAAEHLRYLAEKLSGGSVLMAILSNKASERLTQAKINIPFPALSRPRFPGSDVARRIVLATQAARENNDRTVTHNKGIMNGINALAVATGNDTRAIEAAAHAHACQNGRYQPLSHFYIDGNSLCGKLELPLPFAVTGGAVSYHPSSRWALGLLNHPSATQLSRIAAAVGLVQNLAALRALVSEGIQDGHMALHARRLAYQTGAREESTHHLSPKIQVRNIPHATQARETIASCRSLAHPSLALIKYWGKSDVALNLPATPSLAITLDSLHTETEVLLQKTVQSPSEISQSSSPPIVARDIVEINGQAQDAARFIPFFREFRRLVRQANLGLPQFTVQVNSHANFTSAAGLASSSSGFCALALACCRAAGLKLADSELSALARLGSASASRSLWGGFTRLNAGHHFAQPLYPADWWPELRIIVLQIDSKVKKTSSRRAMEITRKTSPYYTSWLNNAPKTMNSALTALAERNLQALGPLIRESYLRMFSTMFSARPPIIYWKPESLEILKLCEELRMNGTEVWETMDAGPQVKLFCEVDNVERILDDIHKILPNLKSFVCCAGEGARVLTVEEYHS